MPDLDATCSLDLGCPIDEFSAFCDQHPDRTVVVYANTSAAVKARADWLVTSSCALEIVSALESRRPEDSVGARPPPGRLHSARNGRRHAVLERRLHRPRRVQGAGAGVAQEAAPRTPRCWCTPKAPPMSWLWPMLWAPPAPSSRPLARWIATEFIVATDNGMMHKLRHAQPRQDVLRSPHGGQQRHLQELRALPLDGHERPGRRGPCAGNRRQCRGR